MKSTYIFLFGVLFSSHSHAMEEDPNSKSPPNTSRTKSQLIEHSNTIDSSQILPICSIDLTREDLTREVFFRSLDTMSLVRLSRTNKSHLALCSNEVIFRKELYDDFRNRKRVIDENFNRNEDFKKIQREKAKEGKLVPQDLYDYLALIVKTPSETVELALEGKKAKNQKNYPKAIPLLQEAALYRWWTAMCDLGEIYEAKKDFYTAYLWYILSFQYYWLETFKPSKDIKNKLLNICKDNKKLRDQKQHLDNFDETGGFFSLYPESSQMDMEKALINLFISYSMPIHEPYLTEAERRKKAHLFNHILTESFIKAPDLRGLLGEQQYHQWKYYSLAAVSYQKSGLPEAFYNLGELYSQGKLDENPNFEHAAYYYEKSNLPLGLYNIGELYAEVRLVNKNRYEKSAYYYAQSNLPEGHYKIASLYYHKYLSQQYQYRKAAYYYEKSNTPDGLYCLGVLYNDGNLGNGPDYQKAAEYYERSATPEAFRNLGYLYSKGKIGGQPDYQKAAECYQNSRTPEAFNNLAYLYQKGKISGDPDYQKAAEYYEKSGSQQALCQLGNFWLQGDLGKRSYRKAAKYYEKSSSPGAFFTLGQLYERGFLSKNQKPNYENAAEYYKKSNKPYALFFLGNLYLDRKLGQQVNYQEVASFFEQSATPEALRNLGHLHAQGFLSENKNPDYQKAAKYYEKSKDPDALLNLAQFHEYGWLEGSPNYLKALEYFESSNHPYKDWMIMDMYRNESLCAQLVKEGLVPEELILQRKEAFSKNCQNLDDSSGKKSFIRGWLSFEDQEWENAFIHFSHAFNQGEGRAKLFIEKLEKKFDKLKRKSQEDSLQREHMISIPNKGLVPITKNRDDIKESHKKHANKEEKKKEHTKKYISFLNNNITTPKRNMIKSYSYEFLDTESEKNFRDFKKGNQKLGELLFDIQDKPWSTTGTGKPEVLKYGINIKGKIYKGCLSRRLNEEDRLVYKITGDRQILILSWKGHYE